MHVFWEGNADGLDCSGDDAITTIYEYASNKSGNVFKSHRINLPAHMPGADREAQKNRKSGLMTATERVVAGAFKVQRNPPAFALLDSCSAARFTGKNAIFEKNGEWTSFARPLDAPHPVLLPPTHSTSSTTTSRQGLR